MEQPQFPATTKNHNMGRENISQVQYTSKKRRITICRLARMKETGKEWQNELKKLLSCTISREERGGLVKKKDRHPFCGRHLTKALENWKVMRTLTSQELQA